MKLSNSKLEKYLHSERCFFWRYILGVTPKEDAKSAERMLWGDVIHKCLERMLTGAMTVQEAIASVEKTGSLEWLNTGAFSPTGWRNKTRLASLLNGWYNKWAAEGLKNRFEILDTEHDAKIPLWFDIGDDTPVFQGIIDVVARDRETGKIIIIDHKTTEKKVDSSYYTDSFQWSNQMSGYYYIGEQLWGDDFGGILINAIQSTKTIPHNCAISPVDRHDWQIADWKRLIETKGAEALGLEKKYRAILESANWKDVIGNFPHSNDYSENFCEYKALNRTDPEFRDSYIAEFCEPYKGHTDEAF